MAAGVRDADGDFQSGDVVAICDPSGQEFARGLTNYPAAGAKNQRAEKIGTSPPPWATPPRRSDPPRQHGGDDHAAVNVVVLRERTICASETRSLNEPCRLQGAARYPFQGPLEEQHLSGASMSSPANCAARHDA